MRKLLIFLFLGWLFGVAILALQFYHIINIDIKLALLPSLIVSILSSIVGFMIPIMSTKPKNDKPKKRRINPYEPLK